MNETIMWITIVYALVLLFAAVVIYIYVLKARYYKSRMDDYWQKYWDLKNKPQNQPTLTIEPNFTKFAEGMKALTEPRSKLESAIDLAVAAEQKRREAEEAEPRTHAFCQETVTHEAHEWRHGVAFSGEIYHCEGWTKETGIRKHPSGYRDYHECGAARPHLPHKYNKGESRYHGIRGTATWCKGVEE